MRKTNLLYKFYKKVNEYLYTKKLATFSMFREMLFIGHLFIEYFVKRAVIGVSNLLFHYTFYTIK